MFNRLNLGFTSLILSLSVSAHAAPNDTAPELINFCKSEQSCGFMDMTGQVVIPAQYEATQTIKHGRAAFQKDGLWGFMGPNAKVVIAPKYDQVWDFTESGFARVGMNGQYGIINLSGEEIIPLRYDDIGHMKGPFTGFEYGSGQVGVISQTGQIITPPKYDYLAPTGFGKPVKYRMDSDTPYGKWGYLDAKTGRELTPPIYDGANIFHNGLGSVKVIPEGARTIVEAKRGMIDRAGKVVIPIIYDRVPNLPEYDDVVVVEKDDVFSVFDLKGQHVCDPGPEFYMTQFKQGHALYRLKKREGGGLRFGFMDKNCQPVTERLYDSLFDYENGLATFERKGASGYLNLDGEEVKTFPDYDSVGHFGDGLASVRKNRKEGLMDESYKLVVKPKYDFIFGTPGALTLAKTKDRFYYVTLDGKEIGPLKDSLPAPVGTFITPINFCGKTYALNSQTGEPIGFKLRDFRKCRAKR